MRALLAAVLVVAVTQAAAHYWDTEAQNQQEQVNSVYPYLSRFKKSWILIKRESE